MNIIIAILFVLLVLVVVNRLRSRHNRTKRSKSAQTIKEISPSEVIDERPSFGAVSIEFSEDCCPAVRSLDRKKFLAAEAPITPLEECSQPRCRCRYVRHHDRRGTEDRRISLVPEKRWLEARGVSNRRSSCGRRKSDTATGPESYNLNDHFSYNELLSAALRDEIER